MGDNSNSAVRSGDEREYRVLRPGRHSERGQAILETALFMPLFFLALFGMFVAVTQGAMSERVEEAIRYGGFINAVQNPYIGHSLYEMYATIDGQDAVSSGEGVNNCTGSNGSVSAQTSVLTDSSRHTFWQPKPGSITTICNDFAYFGQQSGNGTGNFIPPFTTNEKSFQITAQSPVNPYLTNSALLGQTGESGYAFLNVETTGTVGEEMSCGYVGLVVKASLEATSGGGVPLGYYAGSGFGGSWGGSVASPLPSAAPFLGSANYFYCGLTFSPQVVQTPAPT